MTASWTDRNSFRSRRHPAVGDLLRQVSVDGVFHVELIRTVPLLRHDAGNRIGEPAQPVCIEAGLPSGKKNRFHAVPLFLH